MYSELAEYVKLTKNNSGKRTHNIDTFTPHCFVGQVTAKRGCDYFYETNRECSSNYVIGYDGKIGVSVIEDNRSWCTSSRFNDNRAITVECASETYHPYEMKDAVYNSLVNLLYDICLRYNKNKVIWLGNYNDTIKYYNNIKSNEIIISVHRWYANKACPGEWLFSRLGKLAEDVNKRLNNIESEGDIMRCPCCGKEIKVNLSAVDVVVPEPVKPQKKTNEEVAREVIKGEWGNGADRVNRLTAEGYDAGVIQDIVNNLLS